MLFAFHEREFVKYEPGPIHFLLNKKATRFAGSFSYRLT